MQQSPWSDADAHVLSDDDRSEITEQFKTHTRAVREQVSSFADMLTVGDPRFRERQVPWEKHNRGPQEDRGWNQTTLIEAKGIHFPFTSQLRVNAGDEYVGFFGTVLRQAGSAPASPAPHIKSYGLRMFTDLSQMRNEILRRDEGRGLSRLLAGYAWAWKSRKDPTEFDIEVDGLSLRWNSTDKDWVNSANSLQEAGSIHTIQGYDLNYAGVIVGPDVRMDPSTGRVAFHCESYFDKKGMENNPKQNRTYTDADIREYVINIYNVLLTRGIKGTYLYVCDEPLREYLAENYFPEIMNGATVASFVGTTLRADSFHADPDPRIDYERTDHRPVRDRIWREGKSLPDLPPRKSL